MPIYEFKCRDCGKISEVLCRSSEGQTVSCPACGSADMDRLISSSYVVKTGSREPGRTCCGRQERCQSPPCSSGEGCHRH